MAKIGEPTGPEPGLDRLVAGDQPACAKTCPTTSIKFGDRADIITVHLPKTPETLGLIGADQLARTKKGVVIVNAARGGLIDEQALADAIVSGRCATISRWSCHAISP